MIITLGILILIVSLVLLKKNSKSDSGCCGTSIEEQEWCNTECENNPYKNKSK